MRSALGPLIRLTLAWCIALEVACCTPLLETLGAYPKVSVPLFAFTAMLPAWVLAIQALRLHPFVTTRYHHNRAHTFVRAATLSKTAPRFHRAIFVVLLVTPMIVAYLHPSEPVDRVRNALLFFTGMAAPAAWFGYVHQRGHRLTRQPLDVRLR